MKTLFMILTGPVAFGVWVLGYWMFRDWPPDWKERKAEAERNSVKTEGSQT